MKKLLVIICCFLSIYIEINAGLIGEIESGIVSTGYNDVRIPGKGGTFFSLKDDLTPETKIYYRIRITSTINERNNFSLLYAPLTIKSDGRLPENVNFSGVFFPVNSDVVATYTFNSYRLTYRYDIIEKPAFQFGLGFTAKIRDALISLKSDGLSGKKKNFGFVPLINFNLDWRLSKRFGLLLQGDALAASQGRAEDVLLAANLFIWERIGVWAGYRVLEGGADNNEVYTFSMFNYISLGISFTFDK